MILFELIPQKILERLHPLYGLPFQAREATDSPCCAMCLEPMPADVALLAKDGNYRAVCASHEYVLRRGAADAYADYVRVMLCEAYPRPKWMPASWWQVAEGRAHLFGMQLSLIFFRSLTPVQSVELNN